VTSSGCCAERRRVDAIANDASGVSCGSVGAGCAAFMWRRADNNARAGVPWNVAPQCRQTTVRVVACVDLKMLSVIGRDDFWLAASISDRPRLDQAEWRTLPLLLVAGVVSLSPGVSGVGGLGGRREPPHRRWGTEQLYMGRPVFLLGSTPVAIGSVFGGGSCFAIAGCFGRWRAQRWLRVAILVVWIRAAL